MQEIKGGRRREGNWKARQGGKGKKGRIGKREVHISEKRTRTRRKGQGEEKGKDIGQEDRGEEGERREGEAKERYTSMK